MPNILLYWFMHNGDFLMNSAGKSCLLSMSLKLRKLLINPAALLI